MYLGYVSPFLVYNTACTMANPTRLASIAVIGLMLAACAPQSVKQRIDPFPLTFPLVEAGTLEIEGHIVGQPRVRDGIVYLATREGYLTAVVVPSRSVLWRFKADHTISAGPELGESHVIVHDDAHRFYLLDLKGVLIFRKQIDGEVTTAIRESGGQLFFGGSGGKIAALDVSNNGAESWSYQAPGPVTAGPVVVDDRVIFGTADGRLLALGFDGRKAWEFTAAGALSVDPAAAGGRLYFGTDDRYFYCLNASTGKKVWSRRLQGAPLHPALVCGPRLAVAASNSVVYLLARRGGSILSWEAVASRIIHDLAAAGPSLLVSSAAPDFAALDARSGKRAGQYEASGPLAAGAVWSPPFIMLAVEEEEAGRQRLVFLAPGPGRQPQPGKN